MTVQEVCSPLVDVFIRCFVHPREEQERPNVEFYLNESALTILNNLAKSESDYFTILRSKFLLLRAQVIPSVDLQSEIISFIKSKEEDIFSFSVEAVIELALVAVWCEDEELSTCLLSRACELLGFSFNTVGMLGKRTKHQEKSTALLVVKVDSRKQLNNGPIEPKVIPKNVALNSDVTLEVPVIPEYVPTAIGELECCVLLIQAMYVERFETKDDVQYEKIESLLRKVIECSHDWSIRRSALYLRSMNECHKFTERAAAQLQSLYKESLDLEPCTEERMKFSWLLALPSVAEIDSNQAILHGNLGQFAIAADSFYRVGQFDKAAICLVRMGKVGEAEKILEEGLNMQPHNLSLLCLLGDLKNDSEYYERAWKLSNESFIPALKALGTHRFRNGLWAEAASVYENLTKVQPALDTNWYYLGCCQMRTEAWESAKISFMRATSLDQESAQAWNNLAVVCIRLGDLDKAINALKTAAKFDFDNWRIWDNIFRVALQSRDIAEVCHAYLRLLDCSGDKVSAGRLVVIVDYLSTVSDGNKLTLDASLKNMLGLVIEKLNAMIPCDLDFLLSLVVLAELEDDIRALKDARIRILEVLINGNLTDQSEVSKLIKAFQETESLLDESERYMILQKLSD